MRDEDTGTFVSMLSDVYGLYPQAKPLTPGQIAMFMRAVSAHPIETIRAAFDAHVKDGTRGRFAPLPADVIAQIEAERHADGRPGPEEAWAIAVRSFDEAETVVWTAEMAEAWGVALPVMQGGDEVGARMAFREVYLRLIDASRRAGVRVEWRVSLGFDTARRQHAIEHAVQAGRLPSSELKALPPPQRGVLALEGPTSSVENGMRQVLRALADRLRVKREVPITAENDHERTAELKEEAARRVQQYAEAKGIAL